ncbi:hypothetical protein DPMN_006618 [Dreissena polymorpha]|uniref:G-protein coupled receptors family 1 profile domain-containing protein n=1 Tax=Dreissena polymorpha TaxID=45954 RepID=A0A9D4RVJ0_DREPO|nr:hypothetical protein DPMN_006618 [Dreissena polymorpha]
MAHDNVPEAPLRTLTPDGFVHGLVAFIALAMIIGLPGNVLVVLVHRRIKSPTATDWVVFYLAACDICSLVVCGPSYILTMTKLWNLFMPSFLCSFHFTILHSFFLASTSLITVVAVVRRSVINNNREPISARTSKFVGSIVIFVSIGLGSPSCILTKNTPSGFCYYAHEKAQLQTVVYGVYLLIILISNTITCVSYVSIIPKLRNAARVAPTDSDIINSAFVRTRRAATKATICLALVSVVFLFFYSGSSHRGYSVKRFKPQRWHHSVCKDVLEFVSVCLLEHAQLSMLPLFQGCPRRGPEVRSPDVGVSDA